MKCKMFDKALGEITEHSVGNSYLQMGEIIEVPSLNGEPGNVPVLCHSSRSRVRLKKEICWISAEGEIFSDL